jgi:hypothetical protein
MVCYEFECGLGIVLAGPVCSAPMENTIEKSKYGIERYEQIVLFVGTALFITSLAGFGWCFRGKGWYK